MKTSNEKIYTIISDTIEKNKTQVIDALNNSLVVVSEDITDKDLFANVKNEIIKGNGYLIYNLGKVIDGVRTPQEKKSNGEGGGFGAWMSNPQNQELVGMGAGLLGNLFNSGGNEVPPPNNDMSNQMMIQFQLAQQKAQAEADRERAESRARGDKQRSLNMIIAGVVGALVIAGGATAIIMSKKG